MNHLDTSWCPVCSRQILPKRYQIPLTPQPPPDPSPIPAPPPSSPIASAEDTNTTRLFAPRQPRRTTGTVRQKGGGGLVRGTGRVKPNGTIKRSDPKRGAMSALPPTVVPTAVKHRTVIDQSPTPLYCSDECRLADLSSMYGCLSLDYNPDRDPRDSPPLPPVPHNSFSTIPSLPDESDCSSPSTSPDSLGSTLASERNPFSSAPPDMNPSIAALARIYDFPPLPPRPTILDEEPREAPIEFDNDYRSGVMMAARHIKETLCSQKTVRRSGQNPRERGAIPGWTDGSDSWRTSVYSLARPNTPISSTSLACRDERPAAYGSFVASPHRSTGVYSTIDDSNTPVAPTHSAGSSRLSAAARANTSDDLYSKYALAFSRRSDSRTSLSGSAPQAQSFPAPARRREQNILKPGAEGKLLVPDVKLKASSTSSFHSNDGASVSSWRSGSTRSYVRSPLSRQGSEVSVESVSYSVDALTDHHELPCSLPTMKRPTVESPFSSCSCRVSSPNTVLTARSWSYDNVTTYPVMPMPRRKEIRYERRVVDGVTTVVETEVEVQPQLKRLFLFPGKERR
ncbi:hypothetical protein F5148DRAFT_1274687 [Russula earlei]|uniref:Uncharacterized protein n=1 Tax=Russula earlei TaxID=71964 RepID=A0ACC0UG96_9AGAM|nr:hypothetical protein F5148DRAFT_1274687 [Russula earlei]